MAVRFVPPAKLVIVGFVVGAIFVVKSAMMLTDGERLRDISGPFVVGCAMLGFSVLGGRSLNRRYFEERREQEIREELARTKPWERKTKL